jgi:ribosomal-protein-alanine N-acetyltransferase
MRIRRALESDLAQLMAIDEAAGSATHWSPQQWMDIFRTESPARLAWIAEKNSAENEARGIGLLVAQSSPEWELENIAVLHEFRHRGVGCALLATLLEEARARQAQRILLEVRVSNQAAIGLYVRSGFELLARRNDYYRSPTEDALILKYAVGN